MEMMISSSMRPPSRRGLPIKRRDIEDAIAIMARQTPSREILNSDPSLRNSISRLPGEIRNMVYIHCFDIGNHKMPLPSHSQRWAKRDDSFNLLQTCREIYFEASSLREQTAWAYIPITGDLTLGLAIEQVNQSNLSSISPEHVTTLQTLTNFEHVHFHLHMTRTLNEDAILERIAFDREVCSLIPRLRQALLIFTAATPKVVQTRPHKKRHAIIHFDHYFAVWKKRIDQHLRIYTLWHLINIMAQDTDTTWEIRYYEDTAFHELSGGGRGYRIRSWQELEGLCEPYEHISLTMEISGAQLPEGETAYNHTREITPSCAFWPTKPTNIVE